MFFNGSFTVLSLPFQITNHSKGDIPMLLFFSFFIFFTFSLLVFSFSLYKRLKKIESEHHQQLISKPIETDPVGIEHYLTDNSTSFEVPADDFDSDKEEEQGKRKKKKGKKKRLNCCEEEEQELTILYPFTSSSSVMQREIKQQYDELIKCNQSKELTLAQVRQFANCLINARSKLQHKADVIHRKFTITKALLYKADRSSFDRLRQQICKLELEQKRLEEDTFVYNWLQQQLKFSPAYKKMLEIGTCMELMAKSEKAAENTDHEFTDITFEELLAQEKKDSFWQRNGKLRSCSS